MNSQYSGDWEAAVYRATVLYKQGMLLVHGKYLEDLEKKREDPVGYWKSVLVRKCLKVEWVCERLGKLTGKEFAIVLLEKERGG